MKVSVLRECLRSNWHGQNEMNWTFRNVPSASFYFWDETPPEDSDLYDVSELFHDRSIQYILNKKRVIVTTEEPSVLATLQYLGQRNVKLGDIVDRPIAFIARTTWARDVLLHLGVDGQKIVWIPFAENINRFVPRTLPRLYPFPVFLYVGSISAVKGVDVLLAAFRDLNMGHLVLVAGQYNNDDKLIEIAKNTENVHVLPWRTDVEYYYNQADVYVQPQSFKRPQEGGILHFGKPMQWALASGLPLISLEQGSARDFIMNGKNGFICPYYGDIVKRMKTLGGSPELVKKMGIASREYAGELFNPNYTSARYNNLYGVLKECY